MTFGKQKLDVKRLKMNKFIKSIWQLIISTSNATPEVASLFPLLKRMPGEQLKCAKKNFHR